MYFNSFLSAGSCPQTLIIQHHKFSRYFKKYKFRLWLCKLWKFFQNKKEIRFILDLIIHFLATHTKAAVFLPKNKTDVI